MDEMERELDDFLKERGIPVVPVDELIQMQADNQEDEDDERIESDFFVTGMELVRIRQAAQYLGLTQGQVETAILKGDLKAIRFPYRGRNCWRFRQADLDAYMESMRWAVL